MKNIVKRLSCILLFIVSIYLIGGCGVSDKTPATTNNDANENKEELPSEIDGNYLQIYDCYDYDGYPTYEEAFADRKLVKNLKDFNEYLHDEYSYLELSFQPVQKIGYYDGDIDFVQDNDETMLNQSVELDGKQEYVTTLKTVMIDYKISQILDKYIDSGRGFENGDYQLSDFEIPVILGSKYADKYNINDELELNYLFTKVVFKVVGFFEPSTKLSILEQDIILDNYICMPAFETNIKANYSNETFLQLYNIQKNKGMVLIPDSSSEEEVEKYRKQLTESAKEYGLCFDFATLQTDILIE